jgi:aminoglycoside 2'-N-acetyltransferase I
LHVVLDVDGEMVAHASIVPRVLHIAGRPFATGYVEAVTTAPAHQGVGYGTRVMREVGAHIRDHYELGALGTGSRRFYEQLGWRTWTGPSSVRTPTGELRTPDEDGYIMVLPTRRSRAIDLADPISCDWRSGDVW